MMSEYFCFNLIPIHTGIFILSIFMVATEFYVTIIETYNFIGMQHEKPITPNTTIHEFMRFSVEEVAHFYAEKVLYGDGNLKFLVEYFVRFGGLVSFLYLLIGNRLRRPTYYLPFIYYSGVGTLFIIFSIFQHFIETIRVRFNYYKDFLPEKPVKIRNYVFKVLLEYLFLDFIALFLTVYLAYLTIKGKKYLERQARHQMDPIEVRSVQEENGDERVIEHKV